MQKDTYTVFEVIRDVRRDGEQIAKGTRFISGDGRKASVDEIIVPCGTGLTMDEAQKMCDKI